MSAQDFKAWLSKQPTPIESASVTARRFNVHVSTVTSNLERMGYVKTPLGWELPTKEKPVTVVLNLEDVRKVLEPYVKPVSLITFTQEQRESLLAQDHTNEKFVELLLKQLSASNISTAKILRLAIAFHFFDPDNESFTVQ